MPYEDLRNAINEAEITQSSSYIIQGGSELIQLRDTLERWLPYASGTRLHRIIPANTAIISNNTLQLTIWLVAISSCILWQHIEKKQPYVEPYFVFI